MSFPVTYKDYIKKLRQCIRRTKPIFLKNHVSFLKVTSITAHPVGMNFINASENEIVLRGLYNESIAVHIYTNQTFIL